MANQLDEEQTMYLGIFDNQAHNPVPEKKPVHLNSTSLPLTHLYGGLLKSERIGHPVYSANQKVEWKPVLYKDTVTYIRQAG